MFPGQVFQTYQRYNFESKSQLIVKRKRISAWCFRPIKDTILRANHNLRFMRFISYVVFQTYQRYNFESKSYQRYNFESKSQRSPCSSDVSPWCFRPIKDTILRANHNINDVFLYFRIGVSDLSKIQF